MIFQDQKMDFSPSATWGAESSDSGLPLSQNNSPQNPSQLTSPSANQLSDQSQLTPDSTNNNSEHKQRESTPGEERPEVTQSVTQNGSEISPVLATPKQRLSNRSLAMSSEVSLAMSSNHSLEVSSNRNLAMSSEVGINGLKTYSILSGNCFQIYCEATILLI